MPLLTITDLQKAYISPEGSKTRIIDIPHFEMEEGTQIALRGTSGVGKTTFLNLIAGILGADSGRIIVSGEEMTALSESGRDRLRCQLHRLHLPNLQSARRLHRVRKRHARNDVWEGN